MKRIVSSLLLVLLWLGTLTAQTIGQWNVYPSYMDATKCVALDGVVYTQCAGNLFAYDVEDESVQLFDCLTQLNDVRIAQIGASTEAKRVIVVYDNCNIDLIDTKGGVHNISALKDKNMSDKAIHSLTVVADKAYIGTGFGFLVVDMKEGVVRDTYNLNRTVTGILFKEGQPYLATGNDKVYTIKEGDNWHIASSWTVTTEVKKKEITGQDPEYVPAKGLYWRAEGTKGLMGYKMKDNKYEASRGPIQPNSPARDLCYRMQYVGNRLLVAGGTASYGGYTHPVTAMIYEDDEWKYFADNYAELFPKINHRDLTHFVQDPQNENHFFGGSFRTGLYEYLDGKCVRLYNCDNSPIQMIENYGANYCSCMGLQYDEEGNLWMLNAQTDTIIRVLQPNGKWVALYYDEIAGTPTPDDYLFTRSGVRFVISRRVTGRGFFAFYTGQTLANTRDDKHRLFTNIVNQDGTGYDIQEFYCMAEDLDGRVWCGTNLGLFVINRPTEVFNTTHPFEQVKIARNDGSGLADYLLNGVSISCIAVDGGNRKWIGTQDNGLYLVSADGQEMIQHFLAEDTPLLSNNIQCLAIHPQTGQVMIGTDRGLCSYMSDATEAEEELAYDDILVYPNPVTPDYTGPITVKGLTMDSEVKICSSGGQLIWSGVSNGGTFTWNGCDKRGRRVSSGVYHIIANNAEGNKAVVARVIVIH